MLRIPTISQLLDHFGLKSTPQLSCQLLKPPYLMRQGIRTLFICILAIYLMDSIKVSAFDEEDFRPYNSLVFRHFAHRRPQRPQPLERPVRDSDRTCGAMLTKRTQRICSLDCPPVAIGLKRFVKRTPPRKF